MLWWGQSDPTFRSELLDFLRLGSQYYDLYRGALAMVHKKQAELSARAQAPVSEGADQDGESINPVASVMPGTATHGCHLTEGDPEEAVSSRLPEYLQTLVGKYRR
jgi:hypothetical protein